MNLERKQAEQRVAEAKRELKDWDVQAHAMLAAMDERRATPLNPQTYLDLGMDI